ncbi:hypothetical protein NQZ79_g4965 [Umbelopsis isabellina]|nr:hypothetical protein NQZ79_g4965 [Umbelopsis isabellina]
MLSAAMVVGPVIGYVDQGYLLKDYPLLCIAYFASSSAGCSDIYHFTFRLGKRFDLTLLFQSILMIIAQFILLELVVKHRPVPSASARYSVVGRASFSSDLSSVDDPDFEDVLFPPSSQRHFIGRLWNRFWAWERFIDYVIFLLGFTGVTLVLYIIFGSFPVFIEILGAVSLSIEATVPVPQCIANFKARSTHGFSWLILGTWFLGDGFKFFYFIFTGSPLQFIICGAFQLFVDCIVVVQFIIFAPVMRKKLGIRPPQHEIDAEGELVFRSSSEQRPYEAIA